MRPVNPLGATLMAALFFVVAGCERDTSGLEPVPPNTDPVVFLDNFGPGVDFQAFSGSRLDAVSIDTGERFQGTASLRVGVPGPGSTTGAYSGGAFTTRPSRDLSPYNALCFWAKASKAATLDVAGLGNDNTGTSQYEAKWSAIHLTTTWTQYYVPIPFPERLSSERGLFFFAEGPEGSAPYDLWFDEVQFVNVTGISNPRPALTTRTVGGFVGATLTVEGTKTTFDVNGSDQVVEHMPGYFSFSTSNDAVARVTDGLIQIVGGGTATITGHLGTVDAAGVVTLNATAPPATAAPTPTVAAANVIALFSNAYTAETVSTWSAGWDQADLTELKIAGNDTKAYTNLLYAGIEFAAPPIDVSAMTHFHVDVWAPEGTVVRIKLVDFGEDGAYGGAPDSEHELAFTASSSPPFTPGAWIALEVPLTDFAGLTSRSHLAQFILSGDTRTVFIDNVYFHK
jgi:hypothetical protein